MNFEDEILAEQTQAEVDYNPLSARFRGDEINIAAGVSDRTLDFQMAGVFKKVSFDITIPLQNSAVTVGEKIEIADKYGAVKTFVIKQVTNVFGGHNCSVEVI